MSNHNRNMTKALFLYLLALAFLTSCGQPDLQTTPASSNTPLHYHGKILPADISADNATPIARLLFNSPTNTSTPITGSIRHASTQPLLSVQALAAPLVLLFQHHQSLSPSFSPATGGLQSYASTTYGAQGGSVYIVSEQDSSTQSSTSILIYAHYKEQGQQLHGRMRMTTSRISAVEIEIKYLFENLHIQQSHQSVILSGSQSITTHIQDLSTTIIANYIVEDTFTGQQRQSEHFTTILQHNGDSQMSGTLYDSLLGKLDVHTTSALNMSQQSAFPYAGGPLQVFGMDGKSVRISPIHDAAILIEADTNGDSIFDYSAGVISLHHP
ncbi:MAG: hypothetical protein Q9M19_04355 [Mariprofundaceae bacterium]|nr:hypothetical protein [Mariprofundaceae bacterium]